MSRETIINDFPEIDDGATQDDFVNWVKDNLDGIEERVNFVKDKLDINSIDDLSEFGAAYDAIKDLAEDLY